MEQPNPPKLLERVRQVIRRKHYSYRCAPEVERKVPEIFCCVYSPLTVNGSIE